MKKNCQQCGKEFEALRNTKSYCSAKCRKLAFLKVPNTVPTVSVLEKYGVSVPENDKEEVIVPISVDKTKISKTGLNYDWDEISPMLKIRKVSCSGCGEPVWEIGNPCLDCANKMIELKKKGEVLPNWYKTPG